MAHISNTLGGVTRRVSSLGNIRIMHALYERAQLHVRFLTNYKAYTAKISELFRVFERVSVLECDREYRIMQLDIAFVGAQIFHTGI